MAGSGRSEAQAFVRRVNRSTVEVKGASKKAAREAAAVVAAAVAANLGGRSIRLRGVGYGGARVGVTTAAFGDSAVVRMTGPAHFIERDTRRHLVGTGALGDDHGFAMRMPDGRYAMGPFEAGGSHGKHPFARGVKTSEPAVPRVYQREVQRAMRKSFTG